MMELAERIEANANLIPWCVHILGPDDVIAAPSRAAAAEYADRTNRVLFGNAGETFADVMCFVYAAPWPHSKENHAEEVKNWMKDRG